jgi:C4-dicarboxylate transporter DctQ subunit
MSSFRVSFCVSLCRAMTTISMVIIALMALPITYDATMRAFGHPTIWVFEVTLYALIAAGFLANPLSMKSGAHFRVTILSQLFPSLRRALNIFSLCATMLFALLLIGAGVYFVWYSWTNNILSATLLEVPLWIPQLALPLGGVGLFFQALVLLIQGEEPGQDEAEAVGD